MPFQSQPLPFVSRYGAASLLTTIALLAGAAFTLQGPQTGMAPAGATLLQLQTGSGASRGVCGDNGSCRFSGSLLVSDTVRFSSGVILNRQTDIGWSVQAAANQACNTTCVNACVMGEDTSVLGSFVGCSDATADRCLCAGGT